MPTSSPRLIALCLAVAVAGCPVAAPAQDTNTATLGALSRFESETVWVRGGPGHELKGRLVRASDDQLVIRVGGDSRSIPAADIETVEISRGRAKRGALTGAIIGLPLSILGSTIADRPTGGWRVVGVVVGTAAYAGIGAAIGAMMRHRVVVYSRRSSHQSIRRLSRKNSPVGPLCGSVASQTMVSAPCSTLRGALRPPIRVRTHPGSTLFTSTPL